MSLQLGRFIERLVAYLKAVDKNLKAKELIFCLPPIILIHCTLILLEF